LSSQTSGGSDKPSKAWFLLPIFLAFIGGLIMFFILKDEDRKMAKNGFLLGVFMTVAGFVVSLFVPFPASYAIIFLGALVWLGFTGMPKKIDQVVKQRMPQAQVPQAWLGSQRSWGRQAAEIERYPTAANTVVVVVVLVLAFIVYDGKPPLCRRWVSLPGLIHRFEVYCMSTVR
jgi:amino acid transporter